MKKYILSLYIILSVFLITPIEIEAATNTGFVPGQIWYSKEALVEGETVNIHTAVWNGEKDSFLFKVEFYDKNIVLGVREVTLSPLELKDVFIPWKITSGDHVLSAKIISSSLNTGKKENITITRNTTSSIKVFVPVVIQNLKGEPVSQTDALKNQIDKTTAELNNLVPENVSSTVSTSFNTIDDIRDKTFTQIEKSKQETRKLIDTLENAVKSTTISADKKASIEDATKKPITYLKLFFLSVLAFVFGSKIIFYGLLIFLVFLLLRFIFRKIQNR